MESKCKISFSGSTKFKPLRETTFFDVLIVKIGTKSNTKFAYIGAKFPNRFVMKFCIAVDILNVITHANFGDHWFGRFRMARVEFH